MVNGPITVREACEAVKKAEIEKAPGPDGLPASYQKYFEDKLL